MDLSKILPHNYPMILIDNVLDVNLEKKYIITDFTVTKDKIFYDEDIKGISSLVGIEYMAQTIGCYAYYKNGEKEPKIGFLLGTRLYNNSIEIFELSETYTIKAVEIFLADGIVSFECFIYNSSMEECASATLNVYQGDDAKGLIENAR